MTLISADEENRSKSRSKSTIQDRELLDFTFTFARILSGIISVICDICGHSLLIDWHVVE
jgi:hypothetical protein